MSSLTTSQGNPKARRSMNLWGFTDTQWQLNEEGYTQITGSRYAISGQVLPSLLPWACGIMRAPTPKQANPLTYPPPSIPAAAVNEEFMEAVRPILADDQRDERPEQRLRRGHGHSQEEIFLLNYGGGLSRIPDLVVFPDTTDQAQRLVDAAGDTDVCLIPYGGGTNVSHALRCPDDERRMIVSVDMSRMNRVRWVDEENSLACIEAGAVGVDIEDALSAYGFMLGHEPDSLELSTLGGWIATKASGMKRNRYGNIEDIVLAVEAATPSGTLEFPGEKTVVPRESVGYDPKRLLFGSEGNLGIITAAVVRIVRVPAVRFYESLVFPDFESGMAFLRGVAEGGAQPASLRLVDNLQLQLSETLKPAPTIIQKLNGMLKRLYLTWVKGFDLTQIAACTLLFEGGRDEVRWQKALVDKMAKQVNGVYGGEENARRGYELTFAIAYIRDFCMGFDIIAESFETSCSWSAALDMCSRVKDRVVQEHQVRRLPGQPFITSRISQVYPTGVTVYFYLAVYLGQVANPCKVYAELEEAARDEVLRCGGSLSHHHGVGKVRRKFLPRVLGCTSLRWNQQIKQLMDPGNVFGCQNLSTASV